MSDALDELNRAISQCLQAGIHIRVAPLYGSRDGCVLVFDQQVNFNGGRLLLGPPKDKGNGSSGSHQ